VEDYEEETDPVSALWRCLRKGTPLMTIYNTLQPEEPLVLDNKTAELKTEQKKAQVATFKFVKACLEGLNFAPGDCFVLSDLFGDDTTGFVKVCANPTSPCMECSVLDMQESRCCKTRQQLLFN